MPLGFERDEEADDDESSNSIKSARPPRPGKRVVLSMKEVRYRQFRSFKDDLNLTTERYGYTPR